MFYDILERINAFLGYRNKKFLQEKVFVFDILERKNAFLGYKKRSSKSRKIAIFPKGLTHVFGLNMIIFPTSFF